MRRKWQPTPVFLPGESQGRGSLVGCRLWGHTVGHDWSNLAAAAAVYYNRETWKCNDLNIKCTCLWNGLVISIVRELCSWGHARTQAGEVAPCTGHTWFSSHHHIWQADVGEKVSYTTHTQYFKSRSRSGMHRFCLHCIDTNCSHWSHLPTMGAERYW